MAETAEPPWVYEDSDRRTEEWWCPVHNLLIGYPDDEHGHVAVSVRTRKVVHLTTQRGIE